MNVLVTGAFGNIGEGTVKELVRRGHRVRCFELSSRSAKRKAERLRGRAEVLWGDLRSYPDTVAAVQDMDVVIHLAFVIPKLSATGVCCEDEPDWAEEVNVGGTKNLLQAMNSQERPPKIIFASSLHIYGITTDQAPPRRVTDPKKPMENYARHKVQCERLVQSSGLTWSIFRFAAALPFSLKLDSVMFEISLDNRMEYVHNRDVGLALANGATSGQIWGKILHIGGGSRCQYTYRQIVQKVLDGVGVGMLPDVAFSHKPFSTDWIDTEESQRLLRFQRYTLDDYVRELASRLGFRRVLARIFRPLIRTELLRRSPYYREQRFQARSQDLWGRLAVITCAGNSFGQAAAKKLAQEGMRVLLLEKSGEDLGMLAFQIREEGGQVDVLPADFSRGSTVAGVFREIRRRFGSIDVLINYADLVWLNGHLSAAHPTAAHPTAAHPSAVHPSAGHPATRCRSAWERLERDLLGIVRFTELTVEEMKRRRQGHLIYLEPALKLFPFRPGALLRGLRSFFRVYTKYLDRELRQFAGRQHTIRVSLVKAGISTTELLRISRLLNVIRRRGAYGMEVRPETLANRIWLLIVRPEPVIYIPRVVRLFSWMETYAGWIVELIRRRLEPARVKSGQR